MFGHGVTVTIERDVPGGNDVYGDPVAGAPATHLIEGCGVVPRASIDLDDAPGRDGSMTGIVLVMPAGSDILADDRVVIPGSSPMSGRYEINGDPREWESPFTGWTPGIQAFLDRVEG